MAGRDLPETWQKLAESKGVRATQRGIADAAGVGPSTIGRLVFEGRTSNETADAVARVLGVDVSRVYQLARMAVPEGEWTPPAEARWLSKPQRTALEQLIRTMVDREAGGGDVEAAPMNTRARLDLDNYDDLQERRRRMHDEVVPVEQAAAGDHDTPPEDQSNRPG